jgi:hypothetical protein
MQDSQAGGQMEAEFKYLLIAAAVFVIMGYITYLTQPAVTKAVTRVVNDLF